jgi:hypothetical protein
MMKTQVNLMDKSNRMYANTKTWNPFVGCGFDCLYCEPTFKRGVKRFGLASNCEGCVKYLPHTHGYRLGKIPTGYEIIFVAGTGDISFCTPEFTLRIIEAVKENNKKHPEQIYYFQSKNPKYFEQFLTEFPENVILVTTLETNRDKGYEETSKAPLPSVRYRDFAFLKYPKKVVTIEPIMDFDVPIFTEMIRNINPLYVWIGFNSKPLEVWLPEPSKNKVEWFIDRLTNYGIEVRGKDLRGIKVN